MLDLTGTARRVTTVVNGTTTEQLDRPTPCDGMPVRLVLAHLHGLAIAFRDAAHKLDGPTTSTAPDPAAYVLPDDWRDSVPSALAELAEAWRDPAAWEGMSKAGGLTMPAEVTGLVALDELVLHGWDSAVATGQPYDVEPAALDAAESFCSQVPDDPGARDGLFGPRVPVAADAPQLDRVLGLAGRDPRWTPAHR